jgi:hypothetical protein
VAQHLGYVPKARPILRQTHPVVALLHPIRTCLAHRLAPPAGPLCHFMKPILPHRSFFRRGAVGGVSRSARG